MIKRRSVRIKVLQAIYGFEHGEGIPLSDFVRQVRQRINSVNDIYIYILLIIKEIGDAVEQEANMRSSKHIKTSEDVSFNTKFLTNTFIQFLIKDETFGSEVKRRKLNVNLDEVLIQRWYKLFTQTESYQNYVSSSLNFNHKEDSEIIKFLYKSFLLEQEDFHQHMEEVFSNWIDDAALISAAISETVEKSESKLKLIHQKESFLSKLEELEEFGVDLLKETVSGKDKYMDLISGKLKNWDVTRLASMDIIILRMALAELMYFPSIPTKVTINEYIDIAKEYSTPKSKDFVNGILDNLMKELREKGLIVKEGRGLKES